jgi:diguanylate cyclase (GGDEF)-like protein
MNQNRTTRLINTLLSTDGRRRIRLTQFFFTLLVYMLGGTVAAFGVRASLLSGPWLMGWWVFMGAGLALFYVLLRSGWSERYADPALTQAQIIFGVLAVLWGYLMCGPARSAALYPMMLILLFGAFSLTWRRMAALTAFGLAGLGASIAALHHWQPGVYDSSVDISNLLGVSIVLPACSWLAARLSAIRTKLHGQRADLARALADVQRLATRDELTGLVNRRFLTELLARELQRRERLGQNLCLALIDIDHFKRINDTHGHAAGDEVLRAFASEALHSIRVADSLARWGGEEFLLLLPDTHASMALLSVDRLRERIAALRVSAAGASLQVTVSAGVVELRTNETAAEAIARADHALYLAKSQGRDCVVRA